MKKHLFLLLGILASGLILTRPCLACLGSDGDTPTDCYENEASNSTAEANQKLVSEPNEAEPTDSVIDEYFIGPSDTSGVINLDKDTKHSIFTAGSDLTLRREIDGLASAAGNNIDFLGSSEYGLLLGDNVKVAGKINRDLIVAGGSVTITDESNISRDLFVAGSTVTISTNLYSNLIVVGDTLVLDGVTIDGNVFTNVSTVIIKNKSSIAGNLYHQAHTKIINENLLNVHETTQAPEKKASLISSTFPSLMMVMGKVVLTCVLIKIFTTFAQSLATAPETIPAWKSLVFGLLAILGLPLMAIFLILTIIGIPLGIIGLAIWFAATYISASVSGLVLGAWLWNLIKLNKFKIKNPANALVLKYLLGAVALYCLNLIPYLNRLMPLAVTFYGFGCLWLSILNARHKKHSAHK